MAKKKKPPQNEDSDFEFVAHNGSEAAKMLLDLARDTDEYSGFVIMAVRRKPRGLRCYRLKVSLSEAVYLLEHAKLALLESDNP